MLHYDFNKISIIDDSINDMDIIKDIIKTEKPEDAFYITDIGNVIKQHQEWINKMPKVTPHYAIKCNSNSTVIKVLAALNACFVCASEQEIRQVMQHGVCGDRIIFAHPTKYQSHIMHAKKVDVMQMTVDSEGELLKIKDLFPEAKIVIRIRCDAKNTPGILGLKFGCEPDEETVRLIQLTKDLNLNLHGFSFHVGSPCGEFEAYRRGIALCKRLITIAKTIGCDNVQLIDVGGGFPGETGTDIDKFASIINDAIQDLDSSIRIISEPGEYYVTSAFTLASYLHSKKIILRDGRDMRMYYMNCGVFNSFIQELLGMRSRIPELLYEPTSNKKYLSSVWGPTADSYDLIVKDVMLPELHVGDWLVWKDMGAYSIAHAFAFNGFPSPMTIPIIRRSQWESFKTRINAK